MNIAAVCQAVAQIIRDEIAVDCPVTFSRLPDIDLKSPAPAIYVVPAGRTSSTAAGRRDRPERKYTVDIEYHLPVKSSADPRIEPAAEVMDAIDDALQAAVNRTLPTPKKVAWQGSTTHPGAPAGYALNFLARNNCFFQVLRVTYLALE